MTSNEMAINLEDALIKTVQAEFPSCDARSVVLRHRQKNLRAEMQLFDILDCMIPELRRSHEIQSQSLA